MGAQNIFCSVNISMNSVDISRKITEHFLINDLTGNCKKNNESSTFYLTATVRVRLITTSRDV